MRRAKARADVRKEIGVLDAFLRVYCRRHHGGGRGTLCEDCSGLLQYGTLRLEKCPYDPKPKCKDCKTHCYRPEQRRKIREVMRFSGIYFVRRGRVDWLWKYFV